MELALDALTSWFADFGYDGGWRYCVVLFVLLPRAPNPEVVGAHALSRGTIRPSAAAGAPAPRRDFARRSPFA